MIDVAEFLMDNYYDKYPVSGLTVDLLKETLTRFSERVIVISDEDKIVGVSVFVLLPDEKMHIVKDIKHVDMTKMVDLLESEGDNLHFLIVAAKGYSIIRQGLRQVVGRYNPRTASWWNPTTTRFHNYKLGG